MAQFEDRLTKLEKELALLRADVEKSKHYTAADSGSDQLELSIQQIASLQADLAKAKERITSLETDLTAVRDLNKDLNHDNKQMNFRIVHLLRSLDAKDELLKKA